jgi:excisionase family DNA binding protein
MQFVLFLDVSPKFMYPHVAGVGYSQWSKVTMPDTFITVQEAAEQLRVHPQTVRLWLREGKLRGRLIGGRKSGYRIPASEIERLLSPDDEPSAGQTYEAEAS